jgi:hypothetical protein
MARYLGDIVGYLANQETSDQAQSSNKLVTSFYIIMSLCTSNVFGY